MKKYVCIAALIFINGCATPAYRQMLKEEPKYNVREFSSSKAFVQQSVARALLSKKFMIETEDQDKGFILGKRSFPRGRKTNIVLVQAKVMPVTSDKCTVYLNGVETSEVRYVTDRTRYFLFLIPLVSEGGKQTADVKQGEKIISDKQFYDALFSSMEAELQYVLGAQPPSDVTVAFEKLAEDVQIPAEQPSP